MLGTLTFAVLAAIYRSGARRAFWIGLSIVGWGYALLVAGQNKLGGSVSWNFNGNSGFASGESHLATTKLVLWWAQKRETPLWASYPPAAGYSAPIMVPSAVDESDSANPNGLPMSQPPTLAPSQDGVSRSEPATLAPTEAPSSTISAPEGPSGTFIETQHIRVSSVPGTPQPNAPIAAPTQSLAAIAYADPDRYPRLIQIGEYLWALLLGIMGGFVARWMCANRHTISPTAP